MPNPIEWHVISSADWLDYLDTEFQSEEDRLKFEVEKFRLVYRCPKSGHLYVFWKDRMPTVYEPKFTGWSESSEGAET